MVDTNIPTGDIDIAKAGVKTNDVTCVEQYFKFYSKLANQQNMLQDTVRTELYRNSILMNPANYKGKVVLDVGCGSGILSLFAAQAGAKKVYAIEASNMAGYARKLVKANNFSHIIEVIESTIEEAELPEKVDTMVSEPLGIFLLNERMLETFVIARKKFLKPGGRMFPTRADLYVMPFADQEIEDEQRYKAEFWKDTDYYGLDMTCLEAEAIKQKFQ